MGITRRCARALDPVVATPRGPDDPIWSALARRLAGLRDAHRHSVRLVEAGPGSGALLIRAACLARALGFKSVEARAVDDRASGPGASIPAIRDPGIGFVFDATRPATAMREEAGFPADILVWHAEAGAIDRRVLAAADIVIAHPIRRTTLDAAA